MKTIRRIIGSGEKKKKSSEGLLADIFRPPPIGGPVGLIHVLSFCTCHFLRWVILQIQRTNGWTNYTPNLARPMWYWSIIPPSSSWTVFFPLALSIQIVPFSSSFFPSCPFSSFSSVEDPASWRLSLQDRWVTFLVFNCDFEMKLYVIWVFDPKFRFEIRYRCQLILRLPRVLYSFICFQTCATTLGAINEIIF